MISIEQLRVEFGVRPLFNDVSFLINAKDKIALVGKNGAGKSTLLKLIAGKQQPTKGHIHLPSDLTIGYLPQHMIHSEGTTVVQEAEKAFEQITLLQQRVDALGLELSTRTDYESDAYHRIMDQLSHYNELLALSGGGNFAGEVEKTLMGLGFVRSDFDRPCAEFSGGWRMRVELAKILLQQPDVLLLDEPTNHLDIESIQWLEQFLVSGASTVVLVSHDRAFIDAVTNRTIEISLGNIYDYNVHYSKYLDLRKERREQQLRAYENQQKMIAETEDFIERFRYKATKAVQVQSRIKQLEKVERIEIDVEDNARLNLKFQPAPRSGDYPIIIENLQKRYGNHVVIDQVNMTLKRGDKVAFVGKNGEGKSTLVKCIMGQIDYVGSLKLGHNVKVGYFAQNQASLLDEDKSVFETIDYVAVGDIRTKIRDILGAFMFGGEASDKKVKVLSGGERSRLAMIKLLLEPVNLLILDEPTNHLDIKSKEVLKAAIKNFEGTVVVVSHDREFLDGLTDKVYEFANKRVREYLGGIYDFLQARQMENLTELNRAKAVQKERVEKNSSDNKFAYEERKERNKQIRKLEREVAENEKQVALLEEEILQIEQLMANPEHTTDSTLFEQYDKKRREVEQKMYEWELLCEELEALNK